MKKRLFIGIMTILGIAGCTLEDGFERGNDCPPKMFAYDIDTIFQEPYLCMLDENDVTSDGTLNCIPCDFKMNKVTIDERIILAQNSNGKFVYLNKYDDIDESRKYLSFATKDYIVYRYSEYKDYVGKLTKNDETVELSAIEGYCSRKDIIKFDECEQNCSDDIEETVCPDDCESVYQRIRKCSALGNYRNFFKFNSCPDDVPICSFDRYENGDKQFYCSLKSNNNCSQENLKECEFQIPNWYEGECRNNACFVLKCKKGFTASEDGRTCIKLCSAGYHYNNTECEEDSIENCGAKGYVCSENVPNWVNGECIKGGCKNKELDELGNESCIAWYPSACIVSDCKPGFKANSDGKSCVSDCAVGQHYDNANGCVSDDVDNCGAKGRICKDEIKNSLNVNCTEGKCIVTECNKGYTVNGNVCTSKCYNTQYYDSENGGCKDSDENNCGQKDYKCSEHLSNWKTGSCINNTCKVQSCKTGYIILDNECKADCGTTKYYDSSSGACVDSNVYNCGQTGYRCSEHISNWSNGECTSNVCKVTSCNSGYKPSYDGKSCVSDCSDTQYYDSDQAKCVDSNVTNCGQKGYKCSDKILNWNNGNCINNVCKVSSCSQGYTVKNNACVSSCDSQTQYYDNATGACASSGVNNCGQKGYKCSEHISNWVDGSCTTNVCIVSTCSDGYKPSSDGKTCLPYCSNSQYYDSSDGTCKPSDKNNCGIIGFKCTDLAGWDTGNCVNNQCVATGCENYYHLDSSTNKCVADTNVCCGYNCDSCDTSSGFMCMYGSCQTRCPSGQIFCHGYCFASDVLDLVHIDGTTCDCSEGWRNPDGKWSNGCEEDIP